MITKVRRPDNSILKMAQSLIFDLTGAKKEIREAISTPSPETSAAAWAVLLPLVHKLKTFYEFSLKLEKIVPKFLLILCANQRDSGPVAG
jgi:hypothetical protein